MPNLVEAAVKAYIWTVDMVGTNGDFRVTWTWLPYEVKKALATSIKSGLLTMLEPRTATAEWPHWTAGGLKSLTEVAEVPDKNWHKDSTFWESRVAEGAGERAYCRDSTYLERWAEIDGFPEKVIDQCLEELRQFIKDDEGKIDVNDDYYYMDALRGSVPGLFETTDRIRGEELLSAKDSEQAVEAANVILAYRRIVLVLHREEEGWDLNDPTIEKPTFKEAKSVLQRLKAVLTKAAKNSGDALNALRHLERETPAILHWVRTGKVSAELRRQGSFPPEEVGLELLSGMKASRDDVEEIQDMCGEHRWQKARSRLVALHEEGNARFEALDAKLVARAICTGKHNSIFDFYKGGPEGNVQAYCVKCKKKVDILGAKRVVLKKHHLAMMGICPECGTSVLRFVSRRGLEEGG